MLYRSFTVALLAGAAVSALAQTNVSFETYGETYKTATGPMVAGDFNNDGKPDLIECCNTSEQLVFRAGNGDGTFQAPVVAYATAMTAQTLVAADVNGDGKLDLVGEAALNPPSPPAAGVYQLTVWLGNGDGTFQTPETYGINEPVNPGQTVVGNFFGDGYPDIAAGLDSGEIDLFRNEGNGSFVFDKSVSVGSGNYDPVQIAGGDLNGNGITDLAATVQNSNNGDAPVELLALWNDGKGNFTQDQLGSYTYPQITISRLNGVAQMDLLVSYTCTPAYPDYYCVGFDGYYGQGANQLYKRTLVTSSSGVNAADIGQIEGVDVNGDGYGDIVAVGALQCNTTTGTCTNPPQGLYVWEGNADGSFQQTAQAVITSENVGVGSVAMADFNRDGMMDFAQAMPGAGGATEYYVNATARTSCGTYTISPSVTVCQPVDNTYSPSAVRVEATSFDTTQVTAMQEYVDYSLVYSQPVTSFNTTFAEGAGTHLFVTKGWDASGRSFMADRTVTVYNGTPGPVCPAAPDAASLCLPSGATSSSPVLILGNGDTGMLVTTAAQLYIDGTLVVNNDSECGGGSCYGGDSYVETEQNLSSGTHDLVFKVWDMTGNVYEAQKTVTVQ